MRALELIHYTNTLSNAQQIDHRPEGGEQHSLAKSMHCSFRLLAAALPAHLQTRFALPASCLLARARCTYANG